MASRASPEEVYNVVAGAFDVDFYLNIYEDVAQAGLDPIRHFLDEGSREGRDPAPWFSTKAYQNDVQQADPDIAFYHYLTQGWRSGISPQPSTFGASYLWIAADMGRIAPGPRGQTVVGTGGAPADRPMSPAAGHDPWAVDPKVLEDAFDIEFYLASYPDIEVAGVNPLDHFLTEGWREGRSPNREFSVPDYLEFNPDVAALGINPFLHYLVAGKSEGRLGVHDLGFRHRMLAQMKTVPERQAHALKMMSKIIPDGPSGLATLAGCGGDLHITFSHDDFTANIGGLQLCLQREAAGIKRQGIDHLHLFPVSPWPTLRPESVPGLIGVLWNGQRLGTFKSAQLVDVLKQGGASSKEASRRTFAIHSLLGHSATEVLDILAAAGIQKGHLWLHDFTSVCAGFHLMRNDVADCGAPPPDSPACGICVYGHHRSAHVEAHDRLFDALDITVVAPSVSAYETWRAASTAPQDTAHLVHPHATLRPTQPSTATVKKAPLKVAYLGMTALHKGWAAFEDLAEAFAEDNRYAFLHLGSKKAASKIPFREVSVTAQGPDAMRNALLEESVDIVVLWSLCRETFSLAAHEAAAAGAFILTHADSGNIAAFAQVGGFGRVLNSEADLAVLFRTGQVADYARRRRNPMLYDLTFSETTADLLDAAR